MSNRIVLAGALALVAPLSAAAGAEILFARGQWAAIGFNGRCEARSRAMLVSAKRPPGIAGVAFGRGGQVNGRFYTRLSRVPRDGSTVVATIGNQPFLLASRGEWAWARDAAQDSAITKALRFNTGMRVASRDRAGRRFSDRYLLRGAPTAIDAAAAACAQAGKRR